MEIPITHRQVRTNGIEMHIAEAGSGFPVLFLHGFGEIWHAWRRQLPAVAAAGFHAIAPDQRFGEEDAQERERPCAARDPAGGLHGDTSRSLSAR